VTTMDALMRSTPVIPVLTIEDASLARPLAEALVAGGLRTLEVTLRTPAALDAIREMARVKGAIVGAGTVLSGEDLDSCMRAGASFAVSPGLTEKLASLALARCFPFMPGIATASDIIRGLELGLDRFKFFPAETAGGLKALKALAAPFAQCRFCPTGGITQHSAADWLALDAVLCVGGSWLLTEPFDADAVREKAQRAAALRAPGSG
jgi:2-dehydro-3-deoxyphosphogluconate aldolase / (4S)-4-hydroxy-2-oxoglutarate aldolase